jgi:FlaA1/EpsC-like NDP-sugar epimerase
MNIADPLRKIPKPLLVNGRLKFLRSLLLLFFDVAIIIGSFFLAFQLRFGFVIPEKFRLIFWQWVLGLILVKFLLLNFFKLYSFSLRFVGIVEYFRLLKAFFIYLVLAAGVNFWLIRPYFINYSLSFGVLIIDSFISFSLFGFIRLLKRLYNEFFLPVNALGKKTLIVGANLKTERLIKDMRLSRMGLFPMMIADDFVEKLGSEIHGLPIIDFKQDITREIRMNRIETALINLPNATHREIKTVFDQLERSGIRDIRIIPNVNEWKTNVNQIRKINIEDLLSRKSVRIEAQDISRVLSEQVVLVTGASGSIGSEIVRMLQTMGTRQVLALDMDETGIFLLQQELLPFLKNQDFKFVVGSICDLDKMEILLRQSRPQCIFHAAAYKHVPLMESFPEEAIKTNFIGTHDLAQLALRNGVEKFVNISTDKAVNPSSVMGATKRLAEIACQALNGNGTSFISVRFGNVLGSRGSVVPLFQEQIQHGGPVTITHPDMLRYFMSIPEAALLVLQAARLGQGGEVFVLDMGNPVRIIELAENLIRLNGLESGHDIEIICTGMRPGEKLFEELLSAEDGVEQTLYEKIFVARFCSPPAPDFLERSLADFRLAGSDPIRIRALLKSYLPTFSG